MQIINPDDGFRPINGRGVRNRLIGSAGNATDTTGSSDAGGNGGGRNRRSDGGGSDEEDVMGIEAMLVMKMLCKHGEWNFRSTSPISCATIKTQLLC
jgi:hypothetical protein